MRTPFASLTKQTIKKLADSSVIFARGEGYLRSGAVVKVWVEDNKLFAKVFGGHGEYAVTVEDTGGKFSCRCTCPYEGENCKHIVATCLAFLHQRDEISASAERKESEYDDLRRHLTTLDKEDLAVLLVRSLKTHKNWKDTLLKQLASRLTQKGSRAVSSKIYEEQFSNHFDRVCGLLQEFNEYGGGPQENEDAVYDGLEEIVKLFKAGQLNEKTKRQFIDKMFYYYDWDNSGLTDVIVDSIFRVAKTEEDWKYVIGKLQAKTSDSRKSLIIDIYRDHLKDDGTYLKLRMQDLRWGGDYFDLVQYWQKKGDIEKAVATAKEGIEKFDHGLDDLLEYLFKHYKGNDYTTALEYLKRIFAERQNLDHYKRLRKFAHKGDWTELDQWCRDVLEKEKAFHELARVHRFNQEYDQVLAYVLSDIGDDWMWDDGERERFADEMMGRYPKELVPFYAKRIERHIARAGRKNYQQAVRYLKKLKEIYCKHLHQNEAWREFVKGIRDRYANRRALLEELTGL